MPLVQPDGALNWHITITNSLGGLSGRSSIAIATDRVGALVQGDIVRIANIFRDNLRVIYDPGWTVGPVHMVEGTGGIPRVWDDSVTEPGSSAANVYASPATSLVVSKQTGLAGRSERGRIYLPGVVEGNVDEAGIISAVAVADFQTVMDGLQAALVADAAITKLLLLHDSSSPGSTVPTEITNFLVRNVVGTMRPRQRR